MYFFLFVVFFNYRTNPSTAFEIELTLADCYRALGPSGKKFFDMSFKNLFFVFVFNFHRKIQSRCSIFYNS